MNVTDATSERSNRRESPATRVVVGVDGSESSLEALRHAARFARLLDAPLRSVTLWTFVVYEAMPISWDPERDARRIAEQAARTVFGDELPERFEIATRSGPAALGLIEESNSAQLLVVGSRGHGGFAGLLLGSVSAQCAEHAKCPVLVVHAPKN